VESAVSEATPELTRALVRMAFPQVKRVVIVPRDTSFYVIPQLQECDWINENENPSRIPDVVVVTLEKYVGYVVGPGIAGWYSVRCGVHEDTCFVSGNARRCGDSMDIHGRTQ